MTKDTNITRIYLIFLGVVNFVATIVSVIFVDRMGRKALYLEGGI